MSMIDLSDLRSTIVPKSDQLNAEQLLAGPLNITVTDVRVGADDQPISIHYANDGGRPYKPCKTMRKVLIYAWSEDARTWAGKSMTLYNDTAVKFGGMDVGGIRISHLSDIPRDIKVSLTATKGKKALHEIKRMVRAESAPLPPYPADKFSENLPLWRKAIADGEKTADQIIAKVQTKYTMSDAQTMALRAPDSAEHVDPMGAK